MERKFRITVDGRPYIVTVEDLSDGSLLIPGPGSMQIPAPAQAAPEVFVATAQATVPTSVAAPGEVISALGGMVESVLVTVGQSVNTGDKVVVIEAMKMKSPVLAPRTGKVASLKVKPGDVVAPSQVLLTIA
jgi:glutaconyl-CoA/methylmalonyl-CoA decarboxylase subunit gamma